MLRLQDLAVWGASRPENLKENLQALHLAKIFATHRLLGSSFWGLPYIESSIPTTKKGTTKEPMGKAPAVETQPDSLNHSCWNQAQLRPSASLGFRV